MARLSIGIDVAGLQDVEKLSVAIANVEKATDKFVTATVKQSRTLGAASGYVKELIASYAEVERQAAKTFAKVQMIMNSPSQGARSSAEAQQKAVMGLIAVQEKYSSALAAQIILEDKTAQAINQKTAAVLAQNAAYSKLQSKGITPVSGGDYVKQYAGVEKSMEAQARGLAALQEKMDKLNVTRSGLKQGGYAAEIAAETKSMEAQARGLAALQEKMDKLNATRQKLAVGDRVSKSGATPADYASQMGAEAKLYDTDGRLKTSIKSMADYERAMGQAVVANKGFFASMTHGIPVIGSVGAGFDSLTKKGTALHDLFRGLSGGAGALWLTYGQLLPMIAGFIATAGSIKTVKLGAEFDEMSRKATFLSNETGKGTISLDDMQRSLLGLKGLTQTPGELAAGMLEFTRANVSAGEALAKTFQVGGGAISPFEEISRFAKYAEIDFGKAVSFIVSQSSAFGESFINIANIVAKTADTSTADISQMMEAFKNTTSLNTVLGISFTEVAAALGVLHNQGVKGASAGAALTTALTKLIEPSKEVQKVMKDINFTPFDGKTGKYKEIQVIFEDLYKAAEKLPEKMRVAFLVDATGLRGLKAIAPGLKDAGAEAEFAAGKMKEFKEALTEAGADGGKSITYLQLVMAEMSNSGAYQLDLLKASFEGLFVKSYENSSVVNTLKEFRRVVEEPGTVIALQAIIDKTGQLLTMAAKGIVIAVKFISNLEDAGTKGNYRIASATVAQTEKDLAQASAIDPDTGEYRASTAYVEELTAKLKAQKAVLAEIHKDLKEVYSKDGDLVKANLTAAEAAAKGTDGFNAQAAAQKDAIKTLDLLKEKTRKNSASEVSLVNEDIVRDIAAQRMKWEAAGKTGEELAQIMKEVETATRGAYGPEMEKAKKKDMQLTADQLAAKKGLAAQHKKDTAALRDTKAGIDLYVGSVKNAIKADMLWISEADKAMDKMQSLTDKYVMADMSSGEQEVYQRQVAMREAMSTIDEYNSKLVEADKVFAGSKARQLELIDQVAQAEKDLAANPAAGSDNEQANKVRKLREELEKNNGVMENSGRIWGELKVMIDKGQISLERVQEILRDKTPMEAFQKGLKEVAYTGKEMADDIQRATERAFDSMTDMLVDFVMTGKMQFDDFVSSIVADLARIQIQKSITGPLSEALSGALSGTEGGGGLLSLVGLGKSAYSAYTGGESGGTDLSNFLATYGSGGVSSGYAAAAAADSSAWGSLQSGAYDLTAYQSVGADFTSSAASGSSAASTGASATSMWGAGVLTALTTYLQTKDIGRSVATGGGAAAGMYAGAALGSIVPGVGNVIGGAVGAILGAMGVSKLFSGGDKPDHFGLWNAVPNVTSQYNRDSGFTPTTFKSGTSGETESWYGPILNEYSTAVGNLQTAFNDSVEKFSVTLPEEMSNQMLDTLAATDFTAILNSASAGEWEASNAGTALAGVAESFAKGLSGALGSAYATALGTYIGAHGAEGLLADSSAWKYLTEKAKDSIEGEFQRAADIIKSGDMETGLGVIEAVNTYMQQITTAMAPIGEILGSVDSEGNDISKYATALQGIKTQFDGYAEALKAAGVDLALYTDLEKARGIVTKRVVDEALQPFNDAMDEFDLSGLTEYGRSLKNINDKFVEFKKTLDEVGGAPEQYTQLDTWKSGQTSGLIEAILEPFKTDPTAGMTEFAVSLYNIKTQAADANTALTEVGGSILDFAAVADGMINQVNTLVGTIMDPIYEANASSGLSDFAVSLGAVNKQAEAARNALGLVGGPTEAQSGAITTWESGEIEKLLKPTKDAIQEIFDTQGLTDYQKQIRDTNKQFQTYIADLTTAGKDLTDVTMAWALSIQAVNDAAKKPALDAANEIIATDGLSSYELQLRELDIQFDGYAATVSEAGGTLEELMTIEEARVIKLGGLVASATTAYEDSLKTLADAEQNLADLRLATEQKLLADVLATADSMLATATTNLNASFSKAQTDLTEQYQAKADAINDKLGTARTNVSELSSLVSSFKSALDGMNLETSEFQVNKRNAAQADLQVALRAVRSGNLTPAKNLGDTLSTLSSSAQDQFGSSEDYQRDFWKAYSAVSELEGITGQKLTNEERTVTALEAQLEANTKWYDEQRQMLTDQLAAILGTNEAVLSLSEATAAYNTAFAAQADAKKESDAAAAALAQETSAKQLAAAELAVVTAQENAATAKIALDTTTAAFEAAKENYKNMEAATTALGENFVGYQQAFASAAVDVNDIEQYNDKSLKQDAKAGDLQKAWKDMDANANLIAWQIGQQQLFAQYQIVSSNYGAAGQIVGAINAMSSQLAGGLTAVASASGGSGATRVSGSFAVGTSFVPYDMVAEIHKGERIVPAAYNREDSTNAAIVSEIQLLREEMKLIGTETARNTKKMASTFDIWEGDGLPETRTL